MLEPGQTFLLVDDDDAFRERLARALRERGFVVATAASGEQALSSARADPPENAVVDLRMSGMQGLDVVSGLVALDENTRVVVLTGYGSVATAVDAMHRGALHYLQKPVTADELLAAFEARAGAADAAPSTTLGDVSLARAEWEHIQRVLADCGGNISEAARRLRIHRRSLQRKLQKDPPRT